MKKFLSIILGLALIATVFTACGRNNNNKNNSSSTSAGRTPSSSVAPSQSPSMSPDVGMDESMKENLSSGDQGSSLRPDEGQNRTLDEFAAALKEEYGEDYLPNTVIDSKELEEMTGITSDMYDDIYGEKSTMEENPDIFIAVKAKEDKKDEVKKLLEDYKNKMISDNKYDAVKDRLNSTQIMDQDNYVFLFLLGKSDFGEGAENITDKIGEEIRRAEEVLKNMIS